uniref:Large ribosomal subunit protein mL45 n=1 Tax=Trichuris muris TaxID=70415 RepID=A0A5S6QM14_TRIMR
MSCNSAFYRLQLNSVSGYVSVVRYGGTALPNRHWNPKFKQLRREKFLKITLPDYDKIRKQEELSMKDLRAELKKMGLPPHRPWRERPIHVSCSGVIFDPFLPPDDESKVSLIMHAKGAQLMDTTKHMWRNSRAQKKITSYDSDFDPAAFVETAHQLYINAHDALQKRDDERLHQLVTEKAFPDMWDELKLKSIRWQFVESIEPARVVQLRTSSVMHEDNIFAQVTVRMHTKQKLAIFDQFGRLYMGSEHVARNVLEYVVFEKHLSNLYGEWRIHGKIRPSWATPKECVIATYERPKQISTPEALPADVKLEEDSILATQDSH